MWVSAGLGSITGRRAGGRRTALHAGRCCRRWQRGCWQGMLTQGLGAPRLSACCGPTGRGRRGRGRGRWAPCPAGCAQPTPSLSLHRLLTALPRALHFPGSVQPSTWQLSSLPGSEFQRVDPIALSGEPALESRGSTLSGLPLPGPACFPLPLFKAYTHLLLPLPAPPGSGDLM